MAINTPYGYIVGRKDDKYPITSDVDVRVVRGIITPCNGCKRRTYCAMYFSLTRYRLRSRFMHGSNRLWHCMIYVPDKLPQNIRTQKWPNVPVIRNPDVEQVEED